eukprot:m.143465 g.143465  ORF g.143465 m.143465 type:complete len:120 (-) comp20433_c1_seq3:125-484(-)
MLCVCTPPFPRHPGSLCLPKGAFGVSVVNSCVSAACLYDSDCTAREQGHCYPFFSLCYVQFHCHYKGDECAVDADCKNKGANLECRWDSTANTPKCLPPLPPPPMASPAFGTLLGKAEE